MAWWLLRTARIARAARRCCRCGALQLTSYNPEPRSGQTIWTRCSQCGAATLALCRPVGVRRAFVPPIAWESIDDESFG